MSVSPVNSKVEISSTEGSQKQDSKKTDQEQKTSSVFSNFLFVAAGVLAVLGGASLATGMSASGVLGVASNAVMNNAGPVLGTVGKVFVNYVWTPLAGVASTVVAWGANTFTLENASVAGSSGYNFVTGLFSRPA